MRAACSSFSVYTCLSCVRYLRGLYPVFIHDALVKFHCALVSESLGPLPLTLGYSFACSLCLLFLVLSLPHWPFFVSSYLSHHSLVSSFLSPKPARSFSVFSGPDESTFLGPSSPSLLFFVSLAALVSLQRSASLDSLDSSHTAPLPRSPPQPTRTRLTLDTENPSQTTVKSTHNDHCCRRTSDTTFRLTTRPDPTLSCPSHSCASLPCRDDLLCSPSQQLRPSESVHPVARRATAAGEPADSRRRKEHSGSTASICAAQTKAHSSDRVLSLRDRRNATLEASFMLTRNA